MDSQYTCGERYNDVKVVHFKYNKVDTNRAKTNECLYDAISMIVSTSKPSGIRTRIGPIIYDWFAAVASGTSGLLL